MQPLKAAVVVVQQGQAVDLQGSVGNLVLMHREKGYVCSMMFGANGEAAGEAGKEVGTGTSRP
jgi:hypothetical protein